MDETTITMFCIFAACALFLAGEWWGRWQGHRESAPCDCANIEPEDVSLCSCQTEPPWLPFGYTYVFPRRLDADDIRYLYDWLDLQRVSPDERWTVLAVECEDRTAKARR